MKGSPADLAASRLGAGPFRVVRDFPRSAQAAAGGAKRKRNSADLAAGSVGACLFRVVREFLKSSLPLLIAAAAIAAAQTVTVYSEFTRVDPFGQVVRADRGANEPREILSPAIARNALSSFHVVVEGRPGHS